MRQRKAGSVVPAAPVCGQARRRLAGVAALAGSRGNMHGLPRQLRLCRKRAGAALCAKTVPAVAGSRSGAAPAGVE